MKLSTFALLTICVSSAACSPSILAAEAAVAAVDNGPKIGLADSAALRSTVFGTPPQEFAPMPERVPLVEMNVKLPWRQPVPDIYWFDKRLRVWFSAQDKPAPLAVVIAGTGSDGNTTKLSTLRGALYGAGYHVLTLPSPTFPGFIVSTSSTGVAGDLRQDGLDLYNAIDVIVSHLPKKVKITDIDVIGYSLGGANAAVVKSIDADRHKLKIHRAVMINPPVSLFTSIGRLDKMFAIYIGSGDAGIERLFQKLYVQLANLYRASDRVQIDENFLLSAAAATLKTDADYSAAIAFTFRIALVNMFFAGDLYAKSGVVIDPLHPPKVGDPLEAQARLLRGKPFSEYFERVFEPFYLKYRPNSTRESLIADNRLEIIEDALAHDPDYFVQTNSNDLILDADELRWLEKTLGSRIVVYDHGGHLGNIGEKQQIADMLRMLAGDWQGSVH